MFKPKSSILLARTGVWKISLVACGFRSIKVDYSDYPKNLNRRINEVYLLSIKYRYNDVLLKNINFISDVCFAAITLVIVFKWLL